MRVEVVAFRASDYPGSGVRFDQPKAALGGVLEVPYHPMRGSDPDPDPIRAGLPCEISGPTPPRLPRARLAR